jgi:hypothetical protein
MDIAKVLQKIRPGALWSLNDNRYAGLDWKDDSPKPTNQEIIDAWEEVEAELQTEKIKRLRKEAYQLESDHLFFKYQREEIEKQVWLDKVQEIRDRYPLPASSQE